MGMGGRDFSTSNTYRFFFNGQESEIEVHNKQDIYNFGDRIYNPRLSRFFSLDPLLHKFPESTPYSYGFGNPVVNIDDQGANPIYSVLKSIASTTRTTILIEASVTLEIGIVKTASRGMAVDKNGNVLLYNSRDNGASFAPNPGVSTGIKCAALPGAPSVDQLIGDGASFSISADVSKVLPLSVGGSLEMDMSGQPIGIGGTLGLSYSVAPQSFNFAVVRTQGVIMTGTEFEKIEQQTDQLWTRKYEQSQEWNNKLNKIEDIGIWEVSTSELTYLPVTGKENTFEAVIKTEFTFKPTDGQAKPITIPQYENTGVTFKQDNSGNLISTDFIGE